jgi:hypothetical protein
MMVVRRAMRREYYPEEYLTDHRVHRVALRYTRDHDEIGTPLSETSQ